MNSHIYIFILVMVMINIFAAYDSTFNCRELFKHMAKRAKRATRPNPRVDRNVKVNDIIQIAEIQRKKRVEIIPRSLHQEEFLEYLTDNSVNICFGIGPAGSGKTLLATLVAIKKFKEGEIDKIVITRPNVPVDDRDIGYLPGSMLEKMMPWCRPIFDIFEEYFSPRQIEKMIEEGLLEICPIAYIRGRTFKNAFVLVDESQGTSKNSMLSILTRIGENTKMVVTGDIKQSDLGKDNGLSDFLSRYENSERIKVVKFNNNDVERHEVVKEILKLYDEE